MAGYGDKLLLPESQYGMPILAHVIRVVLSVVDHAYVCYSSEAIQSSVVTHLGDSSRQLTWLRDVEPMRGPLAAIANAFEQIDLSTLNVVLTVAGDLPGLRIQTLHLLLRHLSDSRSDVAAAVRDERIQPLLAAWQPKIGEIFSWLADEGEVRLMQVLKHCMVTRVPFTGEQVWEIQPVHTPHDYDVWMDWRNRREKP